MYLALRTTIDRPSPFLSLSTSNTPVRTCASTYSVIISSVSLYIPFLDRMLSRFLPSFHRLLAVEFIDARSYPTKLLTAFITPKLIREYYTWPGLHNTQSPKIPLPDKVHKIVEAVGRHTLKGNKTFTWAACEHRIRERFSSWKAYVVRIFFFTYAFVSYDSLLTLVPQSSIFSPRTKGRRSRRPIPLPPRSRRRLSHLLRALPNSRRAPTAAGRRPT